MNESTGHYSITEQQSSEFAALSGDYNPLHVDAVYSRRLQFGQPVIHGIHHMLSTWNAAFKQLPSYPNTHLSELSAAFLNPIMVNQTIDYNCQISLDLASADLSAYTQGKQILTLTLRFTSLPELPMECLVLEAQSPIEKPINQTFPPKHSNGSCQLYLDTSLANKLFPNLSQNYPLHQLAQIITCTRIVGMKCPGLNSIFSKIDLDFRSKISVADKDILRYFEIHKDARVNILKLGVEGHGMEGSLGTFFRPAPVTQPSFSEVSAKVSRNNFMLQRALVIGGSRGAGETTAKILAAGGANVIITYNKGQSEAEKIKNEITHGDAHCRILEFDVTEQPKQLPTHFEGNRVPTHVYYFASPYIFSNRTKIWDKNLYAKFCRFYLDAFSETVKFYAEAAEKAGTPITFFYPSTIFIDQPEKGFSEYAVAKGAGETLCNQLAVQFPNTSFFAPRLPRMSTDQTSSIILIKCESVFNVMYRELENIK